MYRKNQTKGDQGDMHRTGETFEHSDKGNRIDDMRKANENIRKAQGDDSSENRTGNRPRFDRDR